MGRVHTAGIGRHIDLDTQRLRKWQHSSCGRMAIFKSPDERKLGSRREPGSVSGTRMMKG